jgi:two-component system OmpR family response regulator
VTDPMTDRLEVRRWRIVLVEDDDAIRHLVKMALETIGDHEVLAFSSGAQAIEEASRFEPDLLLLDVSMPEMDGPQTLFALRQQPGLIRVPIVFLTANTQGKDVARYREIGAADVIAKPFNPVHLCERVAAVLSNAPDEPVVLQSRGSALIVEDDPSIRFLLDFILVQQGYRVIEAHDGDSGLQAISDGPITDIVILDIKLPGSDGLQLLERLRSMERWNGVPVMMLSAEGDESSVARALSAGANDYLIKPFDPTELLARLIRLPQQACTVT